MLGFISPVSEPFCDECNRLRLSSTGILFPCLFSTLGLDIKTPIRHGAINDEIKGLILQAIAEKPRQHGLASGVTADKKMSSIGG